MIAERSKVLRELTEDRLGEPQSQAIAQSSQLMDDLLNREAKRLEKQIRSQLKRKSHIERGNRDQLERVRQVQLKREARAERIHKAEILREAKSKELQAITEARFQMKENLVSISREEHEARMAAILAKQVEDAAKLAEFKREKERKQTIHSEKWDMKQTEIAHRLSDQAEAQRRKGSDIMTKRQEKSELIEAQRMKHVQLTQLKGEETTLRLIDAREKKQQLDRRDADKRQQMAEILNEELDKVSVIQLTKEQILQQRKLLALRQKGALREEVDDLKTQQFSTPGPCEYSVPSSSMTESPAPKISVVRPKLTVPGTVDFETAKAAAVPGPGNYTVNDPWSEAAVGAWATGKKTTYIDTENRMKKDLPGPATYNAASPGGPSGGPRIKRDYVKHDGLRTRDWLATGGDVPGPASYTVDEFMRKEKLEKGMKHFYGFKNLLSIDPVVHDDTEKHVHTSEQSDMLVLEICTVVYRFVQYRLILVGEIIEVQ